MPIKSYHTFPTDDTGYLLWRLSNIWRKHINVGISKFKITHVQYLLLASIFQLAEAGQKCSQKEIAKHARIDIMMTSKVLRTLESKKLVQRKKYHLDGRVYICSLSKKGHDIVQKVSPIIKKLDQTFFGSVTQNKFSLKSIFSQTIKEHFTLD